MVSPHEHTDDPVEMSRLLGRRRGPIRFTAAPVGVPFVLAPGLSAPGRVPLEAAVEAVLVDWVGQRDAGGIAVLTFERMAGMLRRFVVFAAATGVNEVADVDAALVQGFVDAPLGGKAGHPYVKRGQAPAPGTQAHRRAAIRLFFDTCRRLGLHDDDPTVGVGVPHQKRTQLTPLTPLEVGRLRKYSQALQSDSRRPAALALILAGASVVETAWVTHTDVDLTAGTVLLPGRGRRFTARVNTLGAWELAVIRHRLDHLAKEFRRKGGVPEGWPLAFPRPADTYPYTHLSPTAGMQITRLLAHAGMESTRPMAVSEYAANAVYALTGSIEQVAAFLGITSLDAARNLIDRGWQAQWAASIQQAGCL